MKYRLIVLLLLAPGAAWSAQAPPSFARLIGMGLPLKAVGPAGLAAANLAKVKDFGAGYGLVFLSPLAARIEAEGFPEAAFAILPESARAAIIERAIAAEIAAAAGEAARVLAAHRERVRDEAKVLAAAELAEMLIMSPYFVASGDDRSRLAAAHAHFTGLAEMIRSGRAIEAAEKTAEALAAPAEKDPLEAVFVDDEREGGEGTGGLPATAEALVAELERVAREIQVTDDPALEARPEARAKTWRFLAGELRAAFDPVEDEDNFEINEFSDLVFKAVVGYREGLMRTDLEWDILRERLKRLRFLLTRLNLFREGAVVEGIDERRLGMHVLMNNFMLFRYDSAFFNEDRLEGFAGGAPAFWRLLNEVERNWKDIRVESPRSAWQALLDQIGPILDVLYKDGPHKDGLQEYGAHAQGLRTALAALRDSAPPDPPQETSPAAGLYDYAIARAVLAEHDEPDENSKTAKIRSIREELRAAFALREELVRRENGADGSLLLVARLYGEMYLLAFDALRVAPERLAAFAGGAAMLKSELKRFLDFWEAANAVTASQALAITAVARRLAAAVYDDGAKDGNPAFKDGNAAFKANGEAVVRDVRLIRRWLERRDKREGRALDE